MAVERVDPNGAIVSNSFKAASLAERDSQSRIQAAKKRGDQAQVEADQHIEGIRDEYVKRSEAESFRNDAALEAQRTKGYERIREFQRANTTDESRLQRGGERDVAALKDHYRETIYSTSHQGEDQLRDLERKFVIEQNEARKHFEDETAQTDARYQQRAKDLRESKETGIAQQDAQTRQEYARLAESHELASEQANTRFDERFQSMETRHQETIDDVESRAGRQLRDIRADTSRKLAAYSLRQKDPFYQMLDIGAHLEERTDAYVLTAKIPEHERSNLQVSVRGNQVVLSGNRRNEEKLEHEPGRVQATSSFQVYTESFPLTYPVESKLLTKEFDGDTLIVTLPKKGPFAEPSRMHPKTIERARAERPQFPGNLPLAAANANDAQAPADVNGEASGVKARKAGRTLS